MSFERPGRGQLNFQCDGCYEIFELSKAEGHEVGDFRACWAVLKEEGWTLEGVEHFCGDCSKSRKADRDNPFRR